MAGGEGSRLRPLTSRRPKPLAPVAGKPVAEHIVNLLRRHGLTEIVATLHYLADEIETYFGDGSALGVTMHYVVEDTPLGTAGAVKMAHDILAGEPFVIISGDALTDVDLSAIVRHHQEQGNDVTIALQRVTNPLEFGVVVTDEQGQIVRFLEKPSWGEVFSDTINTGIYVLQPEILDRMQRGRVYDWSKDLFPAMLRDGAKLGGYVIDAYWTDIGNLEQYQQANYDAISGKVQLELAGEEIRPGVWAGEGHRIHPDAQIEGPVILGRDVRIAAGASITGPAVVGDRAIVERGATVCRSVAWEDVYVGEEASLSDCTVADRNTIEKRATVHENTVIGRGCTIGAGATVNAHLKLWPDKWVSAGSIVSMSLIYGQKWPGSLFGATGISGLANLEITPEFALKLGQAFGTWLKPGPVGDDQPRHPPRLAGDEPLRHLGAALGRRQRARPALLPAAAGALRGAGRRQRRRARAGRARRLQLAGVRVLRRHRDRDRQRRGAQGRKPVLPRGLPAHADGRGRHAGLSVARARALRRRVLASARRAGAAGRELPGRDRLRVRQRLDRAAQDPGGSGRRADRAQRVLRRGARAHVPRRPRAPPGPAHLGRHLARGQPRRADRRRRRDRHAGRRRRAGSSAATG